MRHRTPGVVCRRYSLWLVVLTSAVLACSEGRPEQVTVFDDGQTVAYVCRFGPDDVTTVSASTVQAERAEACLGIARLGCPAAGQPQAGAVECRDTSFNVLENTCVAQMFACVSPVGACTESQGTITFENGARVETTPAFKLYGPQDLMPCVIGETDALGTTVYLVRDS